MSAAVKRFPVRLDTRRGAVDMTHGSGGRAMAQLILELFDSPGLGFVFLPLLLEEPFKCLKPLLDAGRRNRLSRAGE